MNKGMIIELQDFVKMLINKLVAEKPSSFVAIKKLNVQIAEIVKRQNKCCTANKEQVVYLKGSAR